MLVQSLRVRAARRSMLAAVLVGSFGARPAGSMSPTPPLFTAAPCPSGVQIPLGADPGALTCGYVRVPQNRADPRARLEPVILPVAVYASPTAQSREPLVFF